MAVKNVEFHEEASGEFEAAFDWYFERSESAAAKFANEISRAIPLISESPQRGPSHVHGTRKFVVPRFPFVVIYRELPTAI
jgi:plasmid stabilization system protein ParE